MTQSLRLHRSQKHQLSSTQIPQELWESDHIPLDVNGRTDTFTVGVRKKRRKKMVFECYECACMFQIFTQVSKVIICPVCEAKERLDVAKGNMDMLEENQEPLFT